MVMTGWIRSRQRAAIRLVVLLCIMLPCGAYAREAAPATAQGKVLLHTRMAGESEINSPAVAVKKVAGWEQGTAIRKYKNPKLVFGEGENSPAIRFAADGQSLDSAVAVFAAENFAFSDQADQGGKLEFWLKFNSDPHVFKGNKFILRTEPYPPALTIEIYGSRPFLAIEFHGNGDNPATNHRFITYTEGWDRWYAWKQGEWHKLTLTWKRNTGNSAAEMHLFIDDSQEGCPPEKCNDYHGRLPKAGSWGEILLGNFGRQFGMDYSVKDLRSFGSL